MKRWPRSLTIGAISTLIALDFGCSSSNKVTPGAPVLVAFSVATPDGQVAETVNDAGAPVAISARGYFFALFDRILDPTTLEVLDPDAGLVAKEGVATVEWSGGVIPSQTVYIPNGHHFFTLLPALAGIPFGRGPSITITPLGAGLPSGSAITVTLNPLSVRSHDQTTPFVAAADVMSPLIVQTAPLSAEIVVPVPPPVDAGDDAGADDAGVGPGAGGVAPDSVAQVVFSAVTSDGTAAAIQVTATVAGVPVVGLAPVVERDAAAPTGWTVSPPAAGWPAGSVVTVTVGPPAADTFGMPLETAVTQSFTVAP